MRLHKVSVSNLLNSIPGANGLYWYGFQQTMQSAVLRGNNKTFVFYLGADYDTYCSVLNHSTGIWAMPVNVADGHTSNDPHNYLSAGMDSSGYFYIAYGAHTSALYYKKSTNPYDVSAWSVEASIASVATYPKVIVDSNDYVYIFYRSGVRSDTVNTIAMLKSTDGGTSFASAVTIIDSGDTNTAVYAGIIGLGADDSLHMTWAWRNSTDTPDQNQFYNILYAKTLDGGTTWKKSDGTNYTLPITIAASEVVASGHYFQAQHIAMDGSNNPHLVYVVSDTGVYFTKNHIHYCYLNGGTWQDITMPGADYDLSTHIFITGTTFYIFSTQIVGPHREVIMFKSIDSGANWSFSQLTRNSFSDNVNVSVKLIDDGNIELAWSQGNDFTFTVRVTPLWYMAL